MSELRVFGDNDRQRRRGTDLERFHPLIVFAVHRQENRLFAHRLTATQKEGGAVEGLPERHQVKRSL